MLFYNWRIIVLQCCGGLCHTSTWCIIIRYISLPSWASFTPPYSTPLVVTEHQAGLLVFYSSFLLVTCFTHDGVYMSMLLSQFVLHFPSPTESTDHSQCRDRHLFSVNRFISTISYIPFVCVNIQFFSVTYITLCNRPSSTSLLLTQIPSFYGWVWASLVAQLVMIPPAMRETWVWSLGWENPLEKGTATHSSSLTWRIPWTV